MPPDQQNAQNRLSPPSGDPRQAEKYIEKFIDLINQDKLSASHTDLGQFNPGVLQDHYRIDFQEYQVEISHSKHPDSGRDSYIMLFTNLKHLTGGSNDKIILAYLHLDGSQFLRFKKATQDQDHRRRRAEEEKRLKEALKGVDQALEQVSSSSDTTSQSENSLPSPASN